LPILDTRSLELLSGFNGAAITTPTALSNAAIGLSGLAPMGASSREGLLEFQH